MEYEGRPARFRVAAGRVVFLWLRLMILSFLSSQGWESWDVGYRPLIPGADAGAGR
jgi:hypothetical protein